MEGVRKSVNKKRNGNAQRRLRKETDQKKNRKRNFVPASFGMIHVSFYLVSYLGYVKLLRTKPMLDTARLEHLKQH